MTPPHEKKVESWFSHHPTPLLLVLAGVGLLLSIWSLSEVVDRATGSAAIQDAALLAQSIATVREVYGAPANQEVQSDTSAAPDRDSDPRYLSSSSRLLSEKFAEGMARKLPGSRVVVHQGWQAFLGSESPADSENFPALAAKQLRENPDEAVTTTETHGSRRLLRYVVAMGSANQLGGDSKTPIIDISIPLESRFVIDSKADISQGLVFFSFLSLLWFGVAGLTLIASREKTRETKNEAERYRSLSQRLRRATSKERQTSTINQRLQTRLQTEQKLESLSVLSGGLAHDFNNLLVPILANAELLKSELSENPFGSEMIKDIDLAANRASELCKQMLAYTGKSSNQRSRLDVNCAIEQTSRLMGVNIPKNCILDLDLNEALPFVEADATQIEQVMLNLVTNAAEAIGSRPGSIQIRTGLCPLSPVDSATSEDEASSMCLEPGTESPGVFFEVFDDGVGMTDGTREKIFDPFYSTKFTGRGLGLAAVQGIVRSHGGSVQVDSEFGEFTRIRVSLPVADGGLEETEPGPQPDRRIWKGKGRILLADDESAVQSAATRILENLGFEVSTADDGEMASRLFALDPQSYTACLFDITMPRMDGLETLNTVRRLRPDIPILLFSGYTERAAEIEGLQDQRTAFLEKPFRTRILEEKLSGIIGHAQEAGPGAPA